MFCHLEAGFSCVPGTPTSAHACSEICGDGRRINHACDDGNTANGDGCSSTCTIETGYGCQGGSRNDMDVCTELCGDGLNLGLNACDDGNENSGDGCDSLCRVEKGYTCAGGSTTGSDSCVCLKTYATTAALSVEMAVMALVRLKLVGHVTG